MKKADWSKEALLVAVEDSNTFVDILQKLGVSRHGRNTDTLKKYLKKYQIDFVSRPYLARDYSQTKGTLSNEQIFVENSTTQRSIVRRKILQQNLIEYKCSECGLDSTWNGKPLTLQLEHKNGIPNDHRLENLTFLCPNCHSQTDTWAGKGSNKKPTIECKKRPVEEPRIPKRSVLADLSVEELTKLVTEHTFGTVGKMFGISDNAVRRICKKLGIKMPGRGFRSVSVAL